MNSSRIVVGLVGFLLVLIASQSVSFAETQTLTFQDGDGGLYSSTQGANISFYPATGDGGTAEAFWISGDAITFFSFSYVRFPDIIGGNPGQIPPGSTVESASLQLTHYYQSDHGVSLRRVSSSWDETTVSGSAAPANAGSVGTVPAGAAGTTYVVDITSLVQAWVSGTAENWGLELRQDNTLVDLATMSFYSDDAPTVTNRPMLSVTFTPALTATEPTTWGKVKALYR